MKPVEGLELELALLGRSLLAGIVFSAIYDGIRVIRRIFPHGIIWTSFEDLLYWLVTGSWLFLKVCQVNNGIIRRNRCRSAALSCLVWKKNHAISDKMDRMAQKAIEKMDKSRYNKGKETSQESGDGE